MPNLLRQKAKNGHEACYAGKHVTFPLKLTFLYSLDEKINIRWKYLINMPSNILIDTLRINVK